MSHCYDRLQLLEDDATHLHPPAEGIVQTLRIPAADDTQIVSTHPRGAIWHRPTFNMILWHRTPFPMDFFPEHTDVSTANSVKQEAADNTSMLFSNSHGIHSNRLTCTSLHI